MRAMILLCHQLYTEVYGAIKVVVLATILFLSASINSIAQSSDDGDNLFVWLKGNTKAVVYSLDDLDKLTFEDNVLGIWKNNVKTSYEYGTISLLTFSERMYPTAIEEVTVATDGDVQIRYDRSAQQVSAESPRPLSAILVFNLQGRMVTSVKENGSRLQLSLTTLPKGIYVVKAQGAGIGKSIKIIK